MAEVADYVGLLCVRPASQGGDSKFVSVASVHNRLLRECPDSLALLYEPFYFDRRVPPGEVTGSNPAYLRAPVFTYCPARGDRGLSLRWQSEYVWEAPRLTHVPPLADDQERALRRLEAILEDHEGDLTVKGRMQPGDMQFLNNSAVAHGAPAFVDPTPSTAKSGAESLQGRLMRRVWLRRNPEPTAVMAGTSPSGNAP